MLFSRKSLEMPTAETALPGRTEPMPTAECHTVLGTPIHGPFPTGIETILLGLGCFWGAERLFWRLEGVFITAVGYAGGYTPNPTYEEVCSGRTGHTEVVLVAFDPQKVTLADVLKAFWEGHDPTQGMRQGNDIGTQYRSAIYLTSPEQRATVEATMKAYNARLAEKGYAPITTEIRENVPFYYAEDYHQQYLDKNPSGYCGLGGTGVTCPIGSAA